jgi:F-type H+-transporting ATPase subunit b
MRRPALAIACVLVVLASTPALSASDEGGGKLLIQPQFGTIFWTSVTFLILAYLLGRFAWKPLLSAVTAREEGIAADLTRARTEREEAQRLLEEHRALLVQARKERAEAVEAGRQDAERLKAGILDDARRQREQLVKQAETQIQAGLRQAKAELKGTAVDLAIQAATKLLGKSLDEQTQRRLVEDYIADLERLGTGGRPN